MSPGIEYFDSLFSDDADPWRFKSRWYEERKRALTLACLPLARYLNAFEPACANGELSAALAERCESLLVSDASRQAVSLALARTAEFSHVKVLQQRVPSEWPNDSFDLIVISELGYYLDPKELDYLAMRTRASICHGGTVLACHWRRPIEGCEMDGDTVHDRLDKCLALPRISQLFEADLRIDVWCFDPRSVAQREGFA